MTLQIVLRPQLPGQGSWHFWLVHASFFGQSELITHSGLQVGGAPTNPLMQLHIACILFCRHWLFGPHGDGLHGLLMGGATRRDFNYRIKIRRAKKADIWRLNKIADILTYQLLCLELSKNTWRGRTQNKGISIHSWGTTTHRNMIVHIAHSILAANTWTRIHAFISNARLRVWAIVIQYAFWPTSAIRVPEIFCYAYANSSVTLRIRSTRWRRAWIRFGGSDNGCNNFA